MTDLRKKAFDKYKDHKLTSWIICLMFGVFSAAIIFLCTLIDGLSGLSLLLIPLIILPCLFATSVVHLDLSHGDENVTFKKFLNYFLNYYRGPFRSSFRFFYTLLFTLLISIAAEVLFSFVSYGICVAIDKEGINNAISTIKDLVLSGGALNEELTLKDLLTTNYSIFMLFLNVSSLSTLFISMFYFICSISKNSLSIYAKLLNKNTKMNPLIINSFAFSVVKKNKQFKKDYYSLNWPLYLFLFLGFVGGVLMFCFKSDNTELLALSSTGLAILLMSFYLPFYFPNMEVLFDKYKEEIKKENDNLAKQMIERFNKQFNLSDEEKEMLDKKMKEMNKDIIDNDIKEDENNDDIEK